MCSGWKRPLTLKPSFQAENTTLTNRFGELGRAMIHRLTVRTGVPIVTQPKHRERRIG